MQRVAVYIDGMNLFYGLKSKRHASRRSRWPCYYWLDIRQMSEHLLKPRQRLEIVRYFTARVRGNRRKMKRQNTYLEALANLRSVRIHEGYFNQKEKTCAICGAVTKGYEEKMTDVNIAVAMLGDAQDDLFDIAILVSGDGDLAGPVEAVRSRHPGKRVIVAFPPRRSSVHLQTVASGYKWIGEIIVRNSQLPGRLQTASGYWLQRPLRWN